MRQRREQRLIEAFVSEASVETLDEAVLHGLTGGDVMPLHRALLAPAQNGDAGELRSIVADDRLGLCAALPGQRFQLPHDPQARQRGVGDQRQALSGEVVYDREDPEPSSLRESVGDEVERPTFVRPRGERQRRPRPERALPASAATDLELLLAIEPPELLLVHGDPLPIEQQMKTAVAEAPPFPRERP
jgi:hypothetical protein